MALPNNEIFTRTEWTKLWDRMPLPPRQKDITREIMRGLSDKQIATKLGIAVPTVRTHLGRMFARLNVRDRSELILYIIHQFREISDGSYRPSK